MKSGKVSVKTIIVIVILLLVGVLGVVGAGAAKTLLSGASAGADPKGVLATPNSDGKTATISWSTDKAVQGVVLYGASPAALLLSAPETEATTEHTVNLSSLRAAQNYYFRIEVGEETFDNSGIPWSFKTSGSSAPVVTPTVVVVPTVPVVVGGACNRTTDYNHDGAVNTMDFITCMKNGGTTGTASPAATVTGSSCDNVDFDGNGVINSLDKIKCLQNKK